MYGWRFSFVPEPEPAELTVVDVLTEIPVTAAAVFDVVPRPTPPPGYLVPVISCTAVNE
jgi:hypothetical protein